MSKPTEAMFETAATPTPSCPSELLLDRWHLGELEPSRAATVEAHFDDCADCRVRRDGRDAGFAALPVDADRLFAKIEAAGPRRPVRDFIDRLRDWRIPALVAASAAAVFVLAPGEKGIRTKGSDVGLRVFREHAGQVEEKVSGAAFAARDRLRFDVKAPEGSQIMILGVEESGEVYTYYPAGLDHSDRVRRTSDGALSGAIELDDYDGREWLHLVRCDDAFARADLVTAPGPKGVEAPAGCDVRAFEIQRQQ